MTERYKDFSAAKDALIEDPVVVEIEGEKYEFPPFLSAKVVLDQLSFMGEDGAIAAPDLPNWFISIMGEDNFKEISSKVDFNTLQEISTFLLSAYGLTPSDLNAVTTEDEDEGDSPK